MHNILINPNSGIMEFTTGTVGTSTFDAGITGGNRAARLSYDNFGSLNLTSYVSNVTGLDRFSVDGANGRLFSVTDNLSGSLFSVNDIAGLPIIEAFDDNTVIMGAYNRNDFVLTGNSLGLGGLPNTGTTKLYVSGNVIIDGDITRSGNSIFPLMGPAFPRGTNKRVYLPAGLTYSQLGGAPATTNANSGVMNLNPYYLPTDMTGSDIILTSTYYSSPFSGPTTTGVLAFGIYDAKSGLENATLMESFLRSTANGPSTPSVFQQSLSKFYRQGWYITVAARVFSGVQGTGNVSFNSVAPQNLHIFGTPSGSSNYNPPSSNSIPNGYIQSSILTVTGITFPFPNNFSSIPLSSFVIGQTSVPPPIYLMY
jgi:hypothetical protein